MDADIILGLGFHSLPHLFVWDLLPSPPTFLHFVFFPSWFLEILHSFIKLYESLLSKMAWLTMWRELEIVKEQERMGAPEVINQWPGGLGKGEAKE